MLAKDTTNLTLGHCQLAKHPIYRCRRDDVRGLEVSPCGLRQDQLVQGQVRYCPPQTFILFLETVEFLHLIPAHAAMQLPPAVVRLLDNTDPSDRINTRRTLTDENLNLPKIRDNLFRLMPLVQHL